MSLIDRHAIVDRLGEGELKLETTPMATSKTGAKKPKYKRGRRPENKESIAVVLRRANFRRKRAYELRQSGLRWAEVAKRMDATVNAVECLAQRHCIMNNLPRPLHPIQPKTEAEVVKLLHKKPKTGRGKERILRQKKAHELKQAGKSWKEMAEELGTTPSGAQMLARAYTPKKLKALRVIGAKDRQRRQQRSTGDKHLASVEKLARKVYALRESGKGWGEVAKVMGMHWVKVNTYYRYYLRNLA